MKKALRETQTLRAGCSKAEPKKNFAPPQTHFPGAQDDQNLTSWRWSLLSPTDPVWWRSMHAISSYRGNRSTNTHTPTNARRPPDANTLTGPIRIHCLARSVVKTVGLHLSLIMRWNLACRSWRRAIHRRQTVNVTSSAAPLSCHAW